MFNSGWEEIASEGRSLVKVAPMRLLPPASEFTYPGSPNRAFPDRSCPTKWCRSCG